MAVQGFLSVLAVFWLTAVYVGCGESILLLLRMTDQYKGSIRGLVSFALGFGVVGNAVMLLGFFGILTPLSVILIPSLLSIPSLIVLRRLNLTAIVRQVLSSLSSYKRACPLFFYLLILLVVGYWARSLLPPTGFDGLMYHLSTVKLYLREGGFWDIYFNPQTDFPMLTEMHFMIGLALKNDIVAKGIAFIQLVAATILVLKLTSEIIENKKALILSILIFMTLSVIIANGSNCDVDIGQALWTVLAARLLYDYLRDSNLKKLLVLSVIAGLAVGSKIFGVFVVPLLSILFIVYRKRDVFSSRTMAELSILIIIPCLIGAPWYLKSLAYNGTLFLGKTGEVHSAYISFWPAFFSGLTDMAKRVISAPWMYTLFPSEHEGDAFGPIFIIVLPWLLFIKGKPERVKFYLLASVLYLLQKIAMDSFVLERGSSIRYTISTLVFLVPPTVWTLFRLKKLMPAQFRIIYTLVLIIITTNGLVFFKRYNREWIAHALQRNRSEYLHSVLPEYAVIEKINSLPDDSVVMPVYNFSEYLIDIPYINSYRSYDSTKDMLRDLKEKNIGYIFGNNTLDTAENKNPFPQISNKELIFEANGFTLFRLDH